MLERDRAVAHHEDTVSERDRQLLDELDRLVKEKKRELRRKSN